MAYSLAIRFLSEIICCIWAIYTGQAVLANELLPNTKGHEMGWGFSVLGFGMAFWPPIQFLGRISASMNPAVNLANWILGTITGVDFVVLSLADFIGSFLGAILHWVHFLPHYKTLPEPPAPTEQGMNRLVDRRDVYGATALRLASHVTQPRRRVPHDSPFGRAASDLKYYLTSSHNLGNDLVDAGVVDQYYSKDRRHKRSITGMPLERRSIQVADLHEHLVKEYAEGLTRQRTGNLRGVDELHSMTANSSPDLNQTVKLDQSQAASAYRDAHQESEDLYQAAVRADQVAKLSVFATRPAIFSPVFNFLVEVLNTAVLVFGSTLFIIQGEMMAPETRAIYDTCFLPFLVGFLIFILIAGLGGPTAYAANPSRDFGPRLAHYVLPIPGKGGSEWNYAWIPLTAPMFGGAIGAVLIIGMKYMYNTGGDFFVVPRG